jgi:hypothetical protein
MGGGAGRPERHLERNPHETDRFAVEFMIVEVRSDGHGKAAKAAPIALKFYSTNVRIVKWASRRNQQMCPAFAPCGRWNAFVSDLPKRAGCFACPRCKDPMKEVLLDRPGPKRPRTDRL